MSTRRKEKWTFAVMADIDPAEPRPHFVCRRCRDRLPLELPVRVATFVEIGKGFERAHRNCVARGEDQG